ncbi:alpha/beta hydrolase [Flavobacteriaceae bacterium XHP0103]|uniref:alpha/beta hydrolase n=1 Tax=Marixanthotalea marina TaxID=2844359 RepID=UPI002989FEC3|nr:alpha/beta hydrolase [Marixanthotalea marina]MBU3821715.1 alpha/beta hydrolase [Marixanthotalea marina]
MSQELIHVYLMPGMCASPKIFEYIKLPEDQFKIHYLEWIIPLEDETIEAYALRMTTYIEHDNVVLIGVSFGGVLVQEMAKHIKVRKLIIVSSVKSQHELPKRMKVAKLTKAYKLLPTQLVSNIDMLAKYTFGKSVTKRMELYEKYLTVKDSIYISWAIEQMICWNQDVPNPEIVHIHGGDDMVFPIKNIKGCIVLKKGSHIMIINKYKWFNENLPKLILT